MGPKKEKSNLGQALLRQKLKLAREHKESDPLSLVSTYATNPNKSVTEHSNTLDDFLENALLANKNFNTLHEPQIVSQISSHPKISLQNVFLSKGLPIPRRPINYHTIQHSSISKEELENLEREAFLVWRRNLAAIEEGNVGNDKIVVTPFEKNIEFWRQLWRVVERSDLICQVIDCRNPLLFRSEDLQLYVSELSTNEEPKTTLLILNKADFLSKELILSWKKYFLKKKLNFVFFSAKLILDEEENDKDHEDTSSYKGANEQTHYSAEESLNSERILNKNELLGVLEFLCGCLNKDKAKSAESVGSNDHMKTVGMVGYPNVGKSSVINSLLTDRNAELLQRVSVKDTPGHTKHLQTLNLTDGLQLCDCPGLIFPSILFSKAELILNNVLPIDHLRAQDFPAAVQLLCNLISKRQLDSVYNAKSNTKFVSSGNYMQPEELVEQLCERKKLEPNVSGTDVQKQLLKDFVSGKILFCCLPPGEGQGLGLKDDLGQNKSPSAKDDQFLKQQQIDLNKKMNDKNPQPYDQPDAFFGARIKDKKSKSSDNRFTRKAGFR